MKIAYYPYSIGNDYVKYMQKAINYADANVELIPLPSFKDALIINNKIDIVWLNWYEILGGKKLIRVLLFLIIRVIEIILYRIKGTKIYIVFHNKEPHEMLHRKLNLWFYRFLLKSATKIIVLSDISYSEVKKLAGERALQKTVKIQHPCYKCDPKEYSKIDKFNVLFFGTLRPYKNIEMILELAINNPTIYFIIAGKPLNDAYEKELRNLASKVTNVEFHFGFVSKEKVDYLIDKASIMIMPYNINSSLNSGVVYFAASKGINMIVPQIGSINELPNPELVYSYKYLSREEHFIKLNQQLNLAYDDYTLDYDTFVARSKQLRTDILCSNSIEAIAHQIRDNELISKN